MNDIEIQHLRIAEIRIGDRHRKDLGDLQDLAATPGRDRLRQLDVPSGTPPAVAPAWTAAAWRKIRDFSLNTTALSRGPRLFPSSTFGFASPCQR